MKKLFILLLFPMMIGCCNQPQQTSLPPVSETDVIAAGNQLMKGMIDADGNLLQAITAEELIYGHSGGKVQNKAEFIAEMTSRDPFTYRSIDLLDQTIQLAGNAAIVRHIFTAETTNVNGEPGSLRVGNTLVWIQKDDGTLKLLARQAYRLPE